MRLIIKQVRSFNTQPPEGGWRPSEKPARIPGQFQHTAARRRLADGTIIENVEAVVSTHSRPKAAGKSNVFVFNPIFVSTHSRPKAAG